MKNNLLYAPKLQKGDLVRLISPASYPEPDHLKRYIKTLQSWGLRCDTGDSILSKHGYMAGPDHSRLKDLNQAYRDPEVRAIITTRGGAGAYRIADDIDFLAVQSDPKPLVGFSDITTLHLSLLSNCNLGAIHGCLVGDIAQKTCKQLLMSTEPIVLNSDAKTVSSAIKFAGSAQGPIIGGNLQALANSVGVRMPPMKGAILFLEYHKAGLGTIDRYLTQLIRSGVLNGIVGVVLGSFEHCRDYIDRGWSITSVLNDKLKELNVPVLGGIKVGHELINKKGECDQSCIPLGSYANLDANDGTLTIAPIVR